MNKVTWSIFALLTLGILGVLISLSGSNKIDVNNITFSDIQLATSQNGNIADHIFGKTDSKVTLIEFGDYQCPPCGNAYPIIKEVVAKYQDKIRFVFRNFPITTAHANAKAAAATAEAAGQQGKYWEMHDKIYESQSAWSDLSADKRDTLFESYATELGLNIDKFKTDFQGKNTSISANQKINFDYALGKKAGVEGTPTFFLNGTKVDSTVWSDKTKLAAAFDTEIEKANNSTTSAN